MREGDPCGPEKQRQREAILDGLADARRPWKWADRRFTSAHGDFRIYHDHGHVNDTCYGTAYDRDVFAELESEGLIRNVTSTYTQYDYRLTDAGFAAAQASEARGSK